YTPLVGGSWDQVFMIFFFALFGLYAFAAGIEGYMESKLSLLLRLLTLGAAAALLWPTIWLVHLAGLAVLIAVFMFNRRVDQNKTAEAVAAA
ncbi:MAG: TRAP transporter permease, partial [Desulfuromusa sp.]|nr:TRAP transporter permease [Desulfuromusa sp.]